MKKLLLSSVFSLMLFSFEVRAECTTTPDCTGLGFAQTESECGNDFLKCPWNSSLVYCGCSKEYKYTCTGKYETAGTDKCGGKFKQCGCLADTTWENGSCVGKVITETCKVGSIYYSDGTCTSADNYVSFKTVLGIVAYVKDGGKHGQILSPWPIHTDGYKGSIGITWSNIYNDDIASLPNHQSKESAAADFDSCGNTNKIMAAGDASKYPAAWATKKYEPTKDSAGKWCLPSAGVLNSIHNNLATFKNAVKKLKMGYTDFPTADVWSSTEEGINCAATLSKSGAYGHGCTGKNSTMAVYPSLVF